MVTIEQRINSGEAVFDENQLSSPLMIISSRTNDSHSNVNPLKNQQCNRY